MISVVIPTYNRPEILKKTLQRLVTQEIPQELSFEVIVVDDGSAPLNQTIIDEFKHASKVEIAYYKQQNQGQGVARNYGVKQSRGELILFLGDDIIPHQHLIAEHFSIHQKHPEENAGCLGFITWHPDLTKSDFMKWLEGELTWRGYFGGHQFAFPTLKNKDRANFNYFYTSNISLKKSILDRYSFDPEFSSYGFEDIELGYRLETNEQFVLYYNPQAIGYHYHELTLESFPDRMRKIGESAYIFDKKHPQLNKIPPFWKKFIFSLVSSRPFLFIASKFKNQALYYYCLSKKYFLEGLILHS